MSVKSLMFLTSALAPAGLVIEPIAAQADGMSQLGTWGRPAGMGAGVSNVTCDGLAGFNNNVRQISAPRTPVANTNNNATAFRPNSVAGFNNNGGNVPGSIGLSKPQNVYNNRNNDGPAINAEQGQGFSRNFDGGNAARNADTATRTFGSFGGRNLNVQGCNTPGVDTGVSQRMNVETPRANDSSRGFNSNRPISVFGSGNQAGGQQNLNVDSSH